MIGIFPLKSYGVADCFDKTVPGVKEIRKTTSAAECHVMSVGYEEIVPSLVEAVK